MSQVGNTGSTQHVPVDYSSKAGALSGAQVADEVAAGDLDGQNIRYSRENTDNDVLTGQKLRAPELDTPEEVRPTHLESAKNDVGDVSKLTDQAVTKTSQLLQNARNGTLTPAEQKTVKENAEILKGAAEYLTSVGGKNVATAEGKKAVFAGLGFNQTQLDALLSLANPDDAGNSLASLHGGATALQGKEGCS